jgi:hypothetical protein
VKTTLDIDEGKLSRIMALTGIRTKTAAIDFALESTERAARLRKLLSGHLSAAQLRKATDPAYDLDALRAREMPPRRRAARRSTHAPR